MKINFRHTFHMLLSKIEDVFSYHQGKRIIKLLKRLHHIFNIHPFRYKNANGNYDHRRSKAAFKCCMICHRNEPVKNYPFKTSNKKQL